MIVRDGFLVFEDDDKIKDKKMTGRTFVQLASKDSYTPKGDCVVKMFLRIKDSVDPYFQIRGDIAEKITEKVLKQKYTFVERYTTEKENYDMFSKYENCGGVIDIRVWDDYQRKTVVEVKSKEWNDKTYKYYSESPGNENEIWQALYYQFLDKSEKSMMMYVLFNENAKYCIQQNLKINPKDVKFFPKINSYNEAKVGKEIQKALKYKKWCWENKKVPLCDISQKMLDFLIKERNLKV